VRASQNIVQSLGPLGWAIAVAVLVLVCAAIVLAAVAIRAVLRWTDALSLQRRAPEHDPARPAVRASAAGSSPSVRTAGTSGTRSAPIGVTPRGTYPNIRPSVSPVPPENPHSPPTPPLGSRRPHL
jgi:hypothetical protein